MTGTRTITTIAVLLNLAVRAPVTAAPPAADLRVITTTPDLAAIVRAVGGDLVDVSSIARGYQDPHYVEAKPSYLVRVSRADVVYYVGMQLEIGWLPLLLQGARNPDLEAVSVNAGIRVLQKPQGEVSRQFGDIHPDGNPHYWLDPRNGSLIATTIANSLKGFLDDAGDAVIEANLQAFIQELDRRIPEWERRLAPWKGLHFVSYHQQFEYLADFAGWVHEGYIEEKPGIPPSPKHVAELENMMKRDGVPLVVSSNFIAARIPQQVARSTGARYLVLPASVGGEESIDDYIALFEAIVTKIERDLPRP